MSARSAQAANDGASASRALVSMVPHQPRREPRAHVGTRSGTSSAYITQLIANEMGVEGTRARRRTAPQIASDAYQASARRPAAMRVPHMVGSL
ncbi:hypothetical protein ACKTEK_13535 [Tepidamorphus sp. 3E244]|uniref:hypothetical protein n=1 Tax=Tepidamorphus sp. 3E244 TaxID=3385498 RepID=UPI0038FC7B34